MIALAALGVLAVVVALLLTGSSPRVRIPDVVDASLSTAQDRLEAEGFDVTIVRSESGRPIDTVIAQKPGPNQLVKKGSTVRLTVSSGPGTASVPQVEGQQLDVARDRLKTAGFKTKVKRQSSDEVDSGIVISTSPPGGTLVTRDQVITITVSSGPKQVDVPDVTGQPVDAAKATLEDLGLKVKVVEQESADREVGTVLSQSPTGGTTGRAGDLITLTVAAEPSKVDVPDVIGRSQALAEKRLQDAGFAVKVTTEATTDAAQDGRVISTDPAGGTQADSGATITIVVGQLDAATPTTPAATTP